MKTNWQKRGVNCEFQFESGARENDESQKHAP
jgi:hypothetical protein